MVNRPKRYNRSISDRIFGGNHRPPTNLNIKAPFGHLNIDRYTGRLRPVVFIAAVFAVLAPVLFVLFVISLGAIFGLFGMDGPSWVESIAILFVLGIIGETLTD